MQKSKEQNAFSAAQWAFLVCGIAFFSAWLSQGHIFIPLWLFYLLLILGAGFVVFIFVPYPGRGVPGKPGRYEESLEQHRWYPETLPEIVDGRGESPDLPKGAVLPPPRPVPPVPLFPLLLLLCCVAASYPRIPDRAVWREREVAELKSVYRRAEGELKAIEKRALSLARSVASRIDWELVASDSAEKRAPVILEVDDIAGKSELACKELPRWGIQVVSPSGERLSWGGSPRYTWKELPVERDSPRIFSSRTRLYSLLVVEVPDSLGRGRVIVDVPLEVNYKISNRFLRSISLAEILSRKFRKKVEFDFAMGEHGGYLPWRDPVLEADSLYLAASSSAGVKIVGAIESEFGLPLARLSVKGSPFDDYVAGREANFANPARVALWLSAAMTAVWIYHEKFKRAARKEKRFAALLARSSVFAALLVGLRLLLLFLPIPGDWIASSVFQPNVFAMSAPAGIFKNAGEFLISSVFALFLVFGIVKIFRTLYPGHLELRIAVAGGRFHGARAAVKVAIIFVAVSGAVFVSSRLISQGVLNSNPRLVGLEAPLFSVPVLTLHLSFLLIVAALSVAAIFAVRLALVWGRACMSEALASCTAALAGSAVVVLLGKIPGTFWLSIAVAAGILALSARLFPMLRKEEPVSIVFASLFLVLIVTTLFHSAALATYRDLYRIWIKERAEQLERPGANSIQVILRDICEEIGESSVAASGIISRDEAAAFEIWAESSISRLGVSCSCDVFDREGVRISRFAVNLPFEIPRSAPTQDIIEKGPFIEDRRIETRQGAVHYYAGYAPVKNARGTLLGWVEISVPHFFESVELLAGKEPEAPEILLNVQRGQPEPRKDEPRNLVVSRVERDRIVESSHPSLHPGTRVAARNGEWLVEKLDGERYECFLELDDEQKGYIVGYRLEGALDLLFQWATLASIYALLALASLAAVAALCKVPVLAGILPDIAPTRGVGFKQRVLLSFLAVSMLPLVVLGIFSGAIIERRYYAQAESEAIARAKAAVSLINHSIRSEGISFSISDFTGGPIAGDRSERLSPEELARVKESSNIGRVVVSFDEPYLYGAIMVPAGRPEEPIGDLFYRRRLDDDFMKSVARALGTNVNIYFGSSIAASSERELFIGGLLRPILDPEVFVEVALGRSPAVVKKETLGEYSYYVASSPIPAVGTIGNAVLSTPMLYQPIMLRDEIRKTASLVIGLLTLLFAATISIGVLLAGRVFDPIAALREGTRRIIEGDLEFGLESEAPDEIGDLVESFNTMTAALRNARKDLLERQRYLSAVLENVATGVLAIDREGRITTLNPSGERILRLDGKTVSGRKPEDVFVEGLESLRDFVTGAGAPVREAEISLFSGEDSRTVKAVLANLGGGDESLGKVVVFDDLTELIKSKKLSAWLEMARQIAHEIKNPLTPIKLSAQLMKRAFESGSEDFPEIFRDGVETVIQQTEILRRIAGEFSSFGRATRLRPESIEIEDFLADVISGYRGAPGIEIVLRLEKGLRARADREALRKIIVNLLENAIEAMEGGGSISVVAEKVDDRVRVRIIDSGPGLPEEVLTRLFEPYFSTKTNGVGLGLAISQSLARAMDGEIQLRNRNETRGVEAIVTVPLDQI